MGKPEPQSFEAPGQRRSKPALINNQTWQNIPAKWRPHYRSLLALRERLEVERQSRRAAMRQPLEAFSLSMADAATDEFDHGLTGSELSSEQEVLYEIEQALQRIQNNTYGVCEVTGKPISAARLRAVPWARFATTVERALEETGDIRRTQLGELRSVSGLMGELDTKLANDEQQPVAPEEILSQTDPIPGIGTAVSRRKHVTSRKARQRSS